MLPSVGAFLLLTTSGKLSMVVYQFLQQLMQEDHNILKPQSYDKSPFHKEQSKPVSLALLQLENTLYMTLLLGWALFHGLDFFVYTGIFYRSLERMYLVLLLIGMLCKYWSGPGCIKLLVMVCGVLCLCWFSSCSAKLWDNALKSSVGLLDRLFLFFLSCLSVFASRISFTVLCF